MAVAALPAWSDDETRTAFRRTRRVGRIWLVIALGCFSGFLVYVTHLQNHADWLVAHGVPTPGVVLRDPPTAIRCGQVPVPIRFNVSGTDQLHNYFVDGCSGGLSRGQRVKVWYNRGAPNDFVVNGKANEAPLSTLLACVGLVLSGVFGVGWAIRGRRLHLMRRALTDNQWIATPSRVVRFTSPWTKGRLAVEVGAQDSIRTLVTQPTGRRPFAFGSEGPLLVAGDHRAYVLREPEGSVLVFARPPRSKAAARRAQRALGAVGAPSAHARRVP